MMKLYRKVWLVGLSLAWATLVIQAMLVTPRVRAAGPWYVGPGGSDGDTCLSPATRCTTINGALGKPGFVAGDTILVAVGTYAARLSCEPSGIAHYDAQCRSKKWGLGAPGLQRRTL